MGNKWHPQGGAIATPVQFLLNQYSPEEICRESTLLGSIPVKYLLSPQDRELVQDMVVKRWIEKRTVRLDQGEVG